MPREHFHVLADPRKLAASLSAEEHAGRRWKVSPRSFPESTFLCSGLTSAGPKPPETRGNEPHRGAQTPSVLFQAHWTALAQKKKKNLSRYSSSSADFVFNEVKHQMRIAEFGILKAYLGFLFLFFFGRASWNQPDPKESVSVGAHELEQIAWMPDGINAAPLGSYCKTRSQRAKC